VSYSANFIDFVIKLVLVLNFLEAEAESSNLSYYFTFLNGLLLLLFEISSEKLAY
jgi:hypothetical protein